MSSERTLVYFDSRKSSYSGPRKAKEAMSEPVLMPVTTSNVGRVPEAVQPLSTPDV